MKKLIPILRTTCVDYCRIIGAILWIAVLFSGCSSSGDGGENAPVSLGYSTYSTSGSDLILKIPDELDVSQEDIEDIHYYADQVPHCHTTNGRYIDILLAEVCIYYDMLYLFPQYFPTSLDNILTAKAYVEYLEAYDPFTFYFSAEDYEYVKSFMGGERSVIGFTLDCEGQTITEQTPLVIDDISPFTRAWIDGFQKDDRIIQINGISLQGMSLAAVDELFPTEEEETATITVERNGVEITIDTAAEEHIDFLINQDIVYLNIRAFTDNTGNEIRLDFEELKMQAGGSVDKLILDLRDNGGGTHSGMLELTDYLINNDTGLNPILSMSGPAFDDETEYLGDHNIYNIGNFDKSNFVVLLDGSSASASEVVAAALKYYGTATLIGENTYGKGIGQNVVELLDDSAAIIPSVHILPPSGLSYHGTGISPDYYLDTPVTSVEDDPILDAAIEFLNTGSINLITSNKIIRKQKELDKKRTDPFKNKLLKKYIHGF